MKTMKVLNSKEIGYYVNKNVQFMLNKAKTHVLDKDWDRLYIIDGSEGSGKSLLGLQLGAFLDPNFNLDQVVFSGTEFAKAIVKSTKGQCIIFDEAFNGLSSSGAMSKMNKFIVRQLQECRQKNLFIIIILPTFFMLQKYVGIFRSQALFHVYALKNGNRGYFRVYNKYNKKFLYLSGHKYYSYQKPFIKFSYRFYGIYPVDEEAYRQKKHDALVYQEEEKKIDKYMNKFALLSKYLKQERGMSYADQIRMLNKGGEVMKANTLSDVIARISRKTSDFAIPL